MSFILEALKKAEAERQRQTGPTLLEVRVTTPRRRFPLWTLIIGALLAVNILLLVIFGLRRPAASPTPAATAASPVVATPAAPVSAATVAAAVPTPLSATAPAAAAAAAPMASTAAAPATATPVVPAAATPVTAAPARSAPVLAAAPSENPADFEPALPASDAGPDVGRAVGRAAGPAVSPGVGDRNRDSNTSDINTNSNSNSNSNRHGALPSLAEVADMPDLRLDLHVYSTRAADRYALINMHPVHEGDVLPEGPRVLTIDRDGVALSYRGNEFMLRPQ